MIDSVQKIELRGVKRMSIHLSMPSDLVGVIQQETMNADDLYTPKYTRFSGAQKEGYCDLCSPGKWLKMKNSTFWYHKQFFHGISHKTCTWFDSPSETRMNKDVPEGKCHKCLEWIPLLKQKRKNGNINWFHHAASCHFRDEKRKRYDTEDLLNELKRRKDDLSEDEFDLASLQPQSTVTSPNGNILFNPSLPTTASTSTSLLKSPNSPTSPVKRSSPQLPMLKPDINRPRPIDTVQYHNSNTVSPHQLSPQDRANHENLLQLQLHHMQQIQQIQMMLYNNPQQASGTTTTTASPLQSPPQQHYGMMNMDGQHPLRPMPSNGPPSQRIYQPQQQRSMGLPPKPIQKTPVLPNLPPLQTSKNNHSNNPDDMFFE